MKHHTRPGAAGSSIAGGPSPVPLHVLARNPRVGSAPLRVLLFVWPSLDGSEFREVRQEWVAEQLRMTQQSVSAILRTLVAERFLERGDKNGQAHTYRIVVA